MGLGAKPAIREDGHTEGCYLQDDVERSLRTSLVAVLSAALADEGASAEYLRGVFDLAQSQSALYGIPWCDVLRRLGRVPELWKLEYALRGSCRQR